MRPGGSVGDDETSDGSTIASLPFPPDILAAVGDCAAFGGIVSPGSSEFLKRMAAEIRREIIAINRMDSALVERDIAARRREASLGRRWATMRARIQKELERQGMSEADWCKRELDCDIRTMGRRVQLARGWTQYETARRDAGSNGQY